MPEAGKAPPSAGIRVGKAASGRGPDLDRHVAAIQEFADAGVDELYIQQIGGGDEEFFEVFAREVLPRFG